MSASMVEVIVPVYNGEKTIERTIDSIINQTYKNWHLFIINDGSKDNTKYILNTYEVHPQITVVNQSNAGVGAARNKGLDLASGKGFIACCDADDFWEPNHLEVSVNLLNSGYDLVYCNPNLIDTNGKTLYPNFPLYAEYKEENLKKGNFIYISSVVFRGKIGYFDSSLDPIADYDMWLQAAEKGYRFKQHDNKTCTYVVNPEGMAKECNAYLAKLLEKHSKFFGAIRLHLGCGDEILEGYINCDLHNPKADMRFDAAKIPFEDNTVDEIKAYHLIEHFDFMESQSAVREWFRVLKPGGKIRIETPDLLNTCKFFVESDEMTRIVLYGHFFAWPWIPGQAHKFLFTETQLRWLLSQVGFKNITRVSPDSVYYKAGVPAELFLNVEAYK